MATSGTIATTTIDTATLIEHAVRRCGISPAQQTPELTKLASENLYMLMLALANRGLNLWCVQKNYVGLKAAQATYDMPPGTLDVTNVVFSMPTRITGTNYISVNAYTTQLAEANTIVRIGLRFSTISASETVTLYHSPDGITFTEILTDERADFAAGEWYWYQIDPNINDAFFMATTTGSMVVQDFYLATNVYDLPVTPWNRDTYSVMNDKNRQGRPSTSYFFEKKRTPQITLWPVPANDYDHMTIWRHRQIQDVGTLQQELEIPGRWIENIVIQLAYRIALCWQGIPNDRIALLKNLADEAQVTVEDDERDGMPIYLVPNISVYSR